MDVYEAGSVHVVDDVCYDRIRRRSLCRIALKESGCKRELYRRETKYKEHPTLKDALSDVIELTKAVSYLAKRYI